MVGLIFSGLSSDPGSQDETQLNLSVKTAPVPCPVQVAGGGLKTSFAKSQGLSQLQWKG